MPLFKWLLFAGGLWGFVWLPAGLSRWLWFLVVYFVGLNGFFLLQNHWATPSENFWVFIILSHGPWIAVLLDLIFQGKLTRVIEKVTFREILLFEATRFTGIHFLFSARDGDAPLAFAAEACLGETLSAVCAIILYFVAKKPGSGFRMGLMVWNTYGLASLGSLQFKIFFSNPFIHHASYSREIFQYMTDYPQSWMTFFWMPLAFGGHLIIFYKMLQDKLHDYRRSMTLTPNQI